MVQRLCLFIVCLWMHTSILCGNDGNPEEAPCVFREVWGYVYKGEEKWVNEGQCITDFVYFSAQINETGRITDVPNPLPLSKRISPRARMHCAVSAPWNRSLMYWCLKKDAETRLALINDVVHIASAFDGIQINLESIRPEEKEAFLSFLRDIKDKLPKKKILSVTLPARVKAAKDAYDYKAIAHIADRIVLMAYDEHYRTGVPGTIASLRWCQRVCAFAKEMVEPAKLIMGIGLYGRVWQRQEVAGALKYFQTLDLWKQHRPTVKRDVDGCPFFEYQQTVHAVAHYEDVQSLKNKLRYYEQENVHGVGFWRIGQGPAALWKHIQAMENSSSIIDAHAGK
ncbi:MAG: glycosyl hydrolase family 18 protein [Waddliaceae bacterium]